MAMDQYLIYLYEIYEMLLKKEMNMQQEKRAKFDLQGYMRETHPHMGISASTSMMLHCHECYLNIIQLN
jgi:hypothetical protein